MPAVPPPPSCLALFASECVGLGEVLDTLRRMNTQGWSRLDLGPVLFLIRPSPSEQVGDCPSGTIKALQEHRGETCFCLSSWEFWALSVNYSGCFASGASRIPLPFQVSGSNKSLSPHPHL